MSSQVEFILDQIYKFLYSIVDLFIPQKNYLVLSMESSVNKLYPELVRKLKLTFEKENYNNSNTDSTDCIINDNYYNIEFKNFMLKEVQASMYYYKIDDLYKYNMRGHCGFIIPVNCSDLDCNFFGHPEISDLVKYAKVNDSIYQDMKPFVYMEKNHRPLLFILKGSDRELVRKAEEKIENAIQHWKYETDKYYIAYHDSTLEKETIYEGLEWFFSKRTNTWL